MFRKNNTLKGRAYRRVRAAFIGVIAGEAAIFAANHFTGISFLWYNVIGCLVVLATGVLVSKLQPRYPQ